MTAAPTSFQPRHVSIRLALVVTAVFLAIAGLVLLLHGATRDTSHDGSGVAATSVRDVPAFTGVELTGANSVTIRVGGSRRVVVRGDDNLLPLVTTSVADGRLVIGAKRGFTTVSPMRVDVTVPTLDTITLAGSGTIRAGGSTPRLTATLAGTGELKLAALTAADVQAVLVGVGQIDVTATKSLDAILAGVGTILYGGNPADVTKTVEGTGTVTPF